VTADRRGVALPCYPWFPMFLIASCLYVLWSSVAYLKLRGMVGPVVTGAIAPVVLQR